MQPTPAILTFDVGLTNCKAALFDFDGQLLGAESCHYSSDESRPGYSEQDPQVWWQALHTCTHELLQHPGLQPITIAAVGVTGHMHALLAVDRGGQPLTTCWTLFDRRAEAEATTLQREVGQETIYRITGARLEPYTPAAKIRWLKQHQPAIFEQVAAFVSPKDLLRYQLGGDLVTDTIDAAGMLLYDLANEQWSDELLAAVGIRPAQLPEIRWSGAAAGQISKEAAATLGIAAGIPLIVGAGDDVETLGASVVEPGQSLEHIGTTGTVITCVDKPILDPVQRLELYPHVLPDRYLVGGATNAAGRSLDWARQLLAGTDDAIDRLPLTYPPPSGTVVPPLYLPYIKGERGLLWDAEASGVLLGLRDLHTPGDLARGIYEGVALSLKEILEATAALGITIRDVVAGTQLSDPAWAQLRADVYGRPLRFLQNSELTGLGVALLAMVQLGVYPNLTAAVAQVCRTTQQVTPDVEQSAHYTARFARYRIAVAACQPLFAQL